MRLRQDWALLDDQQRPTFKLRDAVRPGWYTLTIRAKTEQLRCYGLLNGTQGRLLISGKRRRRVVRIGKGQQFCRLELIGLNGEAMVSELRLVPQPFSRIKRMVAKKLRRLHPTYGQAFDKKRPFPQQWCDYNRLLSRATLPLVGYDEWIERIERPYILEEQRQTRSSARADTNQPNQINFTIWIWGSRDNNDHCERSVNSLNGQVPGPYRLLLADHQLEAGDPSTWVVLLQVGDQLPRHALRRYASVIQNHPEAIAIYADEDRISSLGRRFAPQFKPAWNPDLLYSDAAYSHSWVIRSDRCLGACQALDTAGANLSLYSLILEATADCQEVQILHVPEILYHHLQKAEAERSASQTAATLQAFFSRHGQALRVTAHEHRGHVVHWRLPDPPPLVSIIIPTRDHGDLLRCCLTSLREHSEGNPPTELILIDNGSSEQKTLDYLEDLEKQPDVRLLRRPGPFNFSALNNEAVSVAKGELVVFLNNDVEAIHGGWLATMAAQALRPEIGAVGAKLLFEDGTVQHAGIVLGVGGIAGHAHKYLNSDDEGYQMRLQLTHNVSAVTAAVLVMRRGLFLDVGGFDANNFAVSYNDVDLCLRLLKAGYRNLYCPDAVLLHHESKSRGAPTDKAAYNQWQREREAMIQRWGALLGADPNYSPHLSLVEENLSLALRTPAVSARTARPSLLS
ncbi:MAG: glycosyltransferase [Cyanobacteriota bacterium]|nr:glycosyltransferase [Cyanobacteriota bacterium]